MPDWRSAQRQTQGGPIETDRPPSANVDFEPSVGFRMARPMTAIARALTTIRLLTHHIATSFDMDFHPPFSTAGSAVAASVLGGRNRYVVDALAGAAKATSRTATSARRERPISSRMVSPCSACGGVASVSSADTGKVASRPTWARSKCFTLQHESPSVAFRASLALGAGVSLFRRENCELLPPPALG